MLSVRLTVLSALLLSAVACGDGYSSAAPSPSPTPTPGGPSSEDNVVSMSDLETLNPIVGAMIR